MELSKLITFIETKDKGIRLLMDNYINIDKICKNLAESFVENYKEDLEDKQIQEGVFRYLCSIGADEGYSGYSFSEALYKQLTVFVKKNNETNLLQ